MTSTEAAAPTGRIRAAQYVRMSTEHQRYSIENQAEAISRYAERRGYAIVRTYEDTGKSGLTLRGRKSLRQLIADVCAGSADFKAILVYDVSRWGRFQDADESAHYEFVCRAAGVPVEYCAEQFDNDGSMSAAIIKNVKRMMAAEYSRDLSTKVFLGQCRIVRMGFRLGGAAGFGLRRQLLDEHRTPKMELLFGDRKSLTTDRVILIPGPPEEVAIVRKIHRLFVLHGRSQSQIASALNAQGLLAARGSLWNLPKVHSVLSNEKYIGNNVFARVSYKLKQKPVANPAEAWVRRDGAFQPIVSAKLFAAAQKKIQDGVPRHSDQALLDALRAKLAAEGRLSAKMIDKARDMACCETYRKRFGTLVNAWELIGYSKARREFSFVEINKNLRALRPRIILRAVAEIEAAGGFVRREPHNDLLTINGDLRAYVSLARYQEKYGTPRWYLSRKKIPARDLTIVVRIAPDNVSVFDYYILPSREENIARPDRELFMKNDPSVDACRCANLSAFFEITRFISRQLGPCPLHGFARCFGLVCVEIQGAVAGPYDDHGDPGRRGCADGRRLWGAGAIRQQSLADRWPREQSHGAAFTRTTAGAHASEQTKSATFAASALPTSDTGRSEQRSYLLAPRHRTDLRSDLLRIRPRRGLYPSDDPFNYPHFRPSRFPDRFRYL
jgi:DNA invertase Pin-like site-specific DNA recombinase